MPYLDQGEFYSEFGSFDVYIDVPKNYVVGATGDLPAGDSEHRWLAKRERKSRDMLAKTNKKGGPAMGKFDLEFPETATKVLHFHQEKVHDFAWFCDKNYYVLSKEVELPKSGRKVKCVAMFTNLDRKYWVDAPDYIAQSVASYSEWNGEYPYNHATAVDGALSAGAGMEYPNITVLGAGGSAENLEMVIMHEVGHNWYYGILGSNERSHPWMDEGLNTYFEGRYWEKYHDDKLNMIPKGAQKAIGLDFTHTILGQEGYSISAAQGVDQPIEGHSACYTSINYGSIVYMKTGLAFSYLEEYLGRETIDKCFHTYYERWKFKHPQPADIQRVFEEVSGQDLGWFFEDYLKSDEKIDFKIRKRRGNVLTVKNRSSLALPVTVGLRDKEGNLLTTVRAPATDKVTEVALPAIDYHTAEVNPERRLPELHYGNNILREKGIFRRCRPLSLNFGYRFPTQDKAVVNFFPALGYNTFDGFMGGLIMYNHVFPQRRFAYHLMPMYGFKSKRITGSAGFTHNWTPKGLFRKIELHTRASAFANILRIKPSLDFHFRQRNLRSIWSHKLTLASHMLANRELESPLQPTDWYLPVYGEGIWAFEGNTVMGGFKMETRLGGNVTEKLGRMSVDAVYHRRVAKKMRLRLRGFAGLIVSDNPAPWLLQYRVSGSGDPFGEHIQFDRTQQSDWLGQQVIRDHGGFGSMTGGTFDRGLMSMNASLKLPGKFFSVFGDVAYGLGRPGIQDAGFYDAGIRLNMFNEAIQINMPLVGTVYDGTPANFRQVWQNVNFSFDPMAAIRSAGLGVLGL